MGWLAFSTFRSRTMAGARVNEIRMHGVRWLLTTAWLLIIGLTMLAARFSRRPPGSAR